MCGRATAGTDGPVDRVDHAGQHQPRGHPVAADRRARGSLGASAGERGHRAGLLARCPLGPITLGTVIETDPSADRRSGSSAGAAVVERAAEQRAHPGQDLLGQALGLWPSCSAHAEIRARLRHLQALDDQPAQGAGQPGRDSSSGSGCSRAISNATTSVSARAVAERRPPVSSAISPIGWPGWRRAMERARTAGFRHHEDIDQAFGEDQHRPPGVALAQQVLAAAIAALDHTAGEIGEEAPRARACPPGDRPWPAARCAHRARRRRAPAPACARGRRPPSDRQARGPRSSGAPGPSAAPCYAPGWAPPPHA